MDPGMPHHLMRYSNPVDCFGVRLGISYHRICILLVQSRAQTRRLVEIDNEENNSIRMVCYFPGMHQKLQKHSKPLFYNACNIYFY